MDSLDKTLDDSNIQMDQEVSQTFYNNWEAFPHCHPHPNIKLYL